IAASNRNLSSMVQSGHFREDLYYRLNVVSIETPPLRERKDDIVPLANSFIQRFSGELKNTIERAMLLAEGRSIVGGDLRLGEVPTAGGRSEHAPVVKIPPSGIPLEE